MFFFCVFLLPIHRLVIGDFAILPLTSYTSLRSGLGCLPGFLSDSVLLPSGPVLVQMSWAHQATGTGASFLVGGKKKSDFQNIWTEADCFLLHNPGVLCIALGISSMSSLSCDAFHLVDPAMRHTLGKLGQLCLKLISDYRLKNIWLHIFTHTLLTEARLYSCQTVTSNDNEIYNYAPDC